MPYTELDRYNGSLALYLTGRRGLKIQKYNSACMLVVCSNFFFLIILRYCSWFSSHLHHTKRCIFATY